MCDLGGVRLVGAHAYVCPPSFDQVPGFFGSACRAALLSSLDAAGFAHVKEVGLLPLAVRFLYCYGLQAAFTTTRSSPQRNLPTR